MKFKIILFNIFKNVGIFYVYIRKEKTKENKIYNKFGY